MQPGQFPLVAALDRYGSMSVNDASRALGISQPATTRAVSEAIKVGLVASGHSETDKRYRELSLTPLGQECVAEMKRSMWPRVASAARQITQGMAAEFLSCIEEIEQRLSQKSMLDRVRGNTLSIVPYSDELAQHFHDINIEWLEEKIAIEPRDSEV